MSSLITKETDELKKLIAENPDLPIVILAGSDANDGESSWTYCSCIYFSVDEILDCDYLDDDDTIFTDRDHFEEKIADDLCSEYADKPDEDFEAAIAREVKKYDQYWKKVIAILATN